LKPTLGSRTSSLDPMYIHLYLKEVVALQLWPLQLQLLQNNYIHVILDTTYKLNIMKVYSEKHCLLVFRISSAFYNSEQSLMQKAFIAVFITSDDCYRLFSNKAHRWHSIILCSIQRVPTVTQCVTLFDTVKS
jgi:hypothetical protein